MNVGLERGVASPRGAFPGLNASATAPVHRGFARRQQPRGTAAVAGRAPRGVAWRALAAVLCAAAVTACVTTRGVSSPPPPGPGNRPVAGRPAEAIVQSALDLVGTPYRYGGAAPQSGFDCSGLVVYVMGLQAVRMPRLVQDQYRLGTPVPRSRLKAGDLVFFTTTGPGATHVGIVTNAARGEFVHAPSDGSRVRVDRLDNVYWRQHWIGTKRVL